MNDNALREQNTILWLALKHHKTNKNNFLTFENRHFLRHLYETECAYRVVKKSTQCGVSEYLILRNISKCLKGRTVFHVLPTEHILQRFVSNRWDQSMQNTPYYRALINETKKILIKSSNTLKLKHVGNTGLVAFTNSNSEANFTEIPADDLNIDEEDQCNQDNIKMAWERLSAAIDKSEFRASQPTVQNFGIDLDYQNTNKMKWAIPCECKNYIMPDFFQHVVEHLGDNEYRIRDKSWTWESNSDINIICNKCGRPVWRYAPGVWVPENSRSKKEGLEISKLFSSTVTIRELVEDRFLPGLKDDRLLQRFYNADLGLAYNAPGAKINREIIEKTLGTHRNMTPEAGLNVMGVDIGNRLHITIGNIRADNRIKITYINAIATDMKELKRIFHENSCVLGVIDGQPERNFAKILKAELPFFTCYYRDTRTEPTDQYKNITVDRTSSMDDVKTAFMVPILILPAEAMSIEGFVKNISNPTRYWNADKGESGAYEWLKIKPDDYFHSMNYMLIARKCLAVL